MKVSERSELDAALGALRSAILAAGPGATVQIKVRKDRAGRIERRIEVTVSIVHEAGEKA